MLPFIVNKKQDNFHPSPLPPKLILNAATYMVEQVEYFGQNDSTLLGVDDIVIEGAGLY